MDVIIYNYKRAQDCILTPYNGDCAWVLVACLNTGLAIFYFYFFGMAMSGLLEDRIMTISEK